MFKSFDSLRLFCVVCDTLSITKAAETLNLSKGAVSHQISKLEDALGFQLFERVNRGLKLTPEAAGLVGPARIAFESIETEIDKIKGTHRATLVVGMTTYFGSRWLSPRLSTFFQAAPTVRLLLEHYPFFTDFTQAQIDVAVDWGARSRMPAHAKWLFDSESFPCCSADLLAQYHGDEGALWRAQPLIESTDKGWLGRDWRTAGGAVGDLAPRGLVVRDPTVRVSTLISGMGIAIMDELIAPELERGQLVRLSADSSETYGYFLRMNTARTETPTRRQFIRWLEATD